MNEIRTIQPYVFLAPDDFKNSRLSCDSPLMGDVDFSSWAEPNFNINNRLDFARRLRRFRRGIEEEWTKRYSNKVKASTTKKPRRQLIQKQYVNVTYSTIRPETIEINIKIQHGQLTTTKKPVTNRRPTTSNKKQRPSVKPVNNEDVVFVTSRPPTRKTTSKPNRKFTQPTAASISNKIPETDTHYTIIETIAPPRRPTRKPEVIYPVFIQYQPNIDFNSEPNNNYNDNGFPGRPLGNRKKPSNIYEKPSSSKPSNYYEDTDPSSTSFPSIRPIDFHDEDTVIVDSYYDQPKPSSGSVNYGSSNIRDTPFASSGRPIYYDVTTSGYDTHKKRPYDRIDEVYDQFSTNQENSDDIPKKPSFGQIPDTIYTSFNQHGNRYSIGVVEKIEQNQIHDKLNFKGNIFTKRKGNSIEKLN